MVKICQTGPLKLNFETRPKKHFPVFAKNFRRPWIKLKVFFANFQIIGPLGCQGWVVIPQIVKKVKITAPYCIPNLSVTECLYVCFTDLLKTGWEKLGWCHRTQWTTSSSRSLRPLFPGLKTLPSLGLIFRDGVPYWHGP